ncbi:MAG: sodium-dependent transporter [Sandaracinaceae bacterium]|nr:sodium-dependent transporter [Sandaracinaceae bacterium]
MAEAKRSQWGSKVGFVLAAAGSAVGLGNLWKFPYITGENGGGAFVLIYLFCILLVGVPIMVGEVYVGKLAQKAPVGAFGDLTPLGSPWKLVGALGVLAGFVILSYYSVVAGWAMHYVYLAATGAFSGAETAEEIAAVGAHFGALYANPGANIFWHTLFMAITVGIVTVGIQKGVELASRIMMPALFVMLIALVIYATTLDGFDRAVGFVFGFHTDQLTGGGVLEALGHSFFTLSLGMGAMLTYGSYMKKEDGVVATSFIISGLDTAVALMACLALFPITFSYGMEAAAGPGLVFVNMPTAFAQMPGGTLWAILFFVLLTFAALTSAISLLEVVASYFIDELKWPRWRAVALTGGAIFLFGIPSALSGGTELFGSGFQSKIQSVFGGDGKNWFDSLDYLASNWMLPLGGLGIALFASWRIEEVKRREALLGERTEGAPLAAYLAWLWILRVVAPVAIVLVMLHALGVL